MLFFIVGVGWFVLFGLTLDAPLVAGFAFAMLGGVVCIATGLLCSEIEEVKKKLDSLLRRDNSADLPFSDERES